MYYNLVDGEPVAVSIHEWTHPGDRMDWVVGRSYVGHTLVSTVFLGLDHDFGRTGRPVLFETMVFGNHGDEQCVRYHTLDEAISGHEDILVRLRTSKSVQPTSIIESSDDNVETRR